MEAKAVKREAVSGQSRGDRLWTIMTDAAQNVLDRPETRRGPYVIRDNDLRIENKAVSGA
ncbi:hypothetical protein AU381_16780 [Sinorhizobium glycinis]|uniref:Uncharacterized protein n=1 Tax=Sinorhizobium glycinis TaxID=1472378 RepID=A0A178XKR8_9HYPH|nr:hypothetical protein AU381_16780 [Sinorhizobium glycinis]